MYFLSLYLSLFLNSVFSKNIQETSAENGKNSLLLVLSSWLVLTPVLAEVTDLLCAEGTLHS